MRPPGLVRHWKTKASVQKAISLLPRSSEINYLFQQYVTRSASDTDGWFAENVNQAVRHLQNWELVSGAGRPSRSVELGTGWHVTVPTCLALWGTDRVTTVDRTSLLRADRLAASLRQLERLLDKRSGLLPPIDETRWTQLKKLAARSTVEPADLASLGVDVFVGDARKLDGGKIDFFTSNNVLEHVPHDELLAVFTAYRTSAADGAVMSHFIDLADHFSAFDRTISSRNFLRYSSKQWKRWDNSLVPQNRLQLSDYLRLHREAGFTVRHEELIRIDAAAFAELPISQEFADYPAEELRIETAWLTSQVS